MSTNGPSPDKFQLFGVATSLVAYGINVCLLIQVLSSLKRARSWATATTLIAFCLTTAFQVLACYIIYDGLPDHSADTAVLTVWPGTQKLVRLWLVLRSLGLVTTWVLDCFVLYQCFTVYSLNKKELWLLGVPVLLFMSSLGSGAYLLAWTTRGDYSIQVLPHFPLCLALKFSMTTLIVLKLFRHRRMLHRGLCGDEGKEIARPYKTLIQILVQSYALYATLSLLFLGLFIANHDAWKMVLPNVMQAGIMSHLLVRYSLVRSTRLDTEKDTASLQFSNSQSSQSSNNNHF